MKETIDEICKDVIDVNVDNPELVVNLHDGILAEKDGSYHDRKNSQTEADEKSDCGKENLKMLNSAEINPESTDNKDVSNKIEMTNETKVDGTTTINLGTCTTFDFANQKISNRMDLDRSTSQICTGSDMVGPGLNGSNNQEPSGSDLNGLTNQERYSGSDLNEPTNQERCTVSGLNVSINHERWEDSELNGSTNQERYPGSDLNVSTEQEGCTQSNLNASIDPERCDKSDFNGSTKQEIGSESHLNRSIDHHADSELDTNRLNNRITDSNLKESTNQERVVECVINKEHFTEAFDGVPDLGGFQDPDGVPDLTDSQLILVDDDCRTLSTQESFKERIGNSISTVHPQQQPLQHQQELQLTCHCPSIESHSVHNLNSNQKSSFDMKIKEGSRLMNNFLSELSAINMSLIRYGREIEQLKRR